MKLRVAQPRVCTLAFLGISIFGCGTVETEERFAAREQGEEELAAVAPLQDSVAYPFHREGSEQVARTAMPDVRAHLAAAGITLRDSVGMELPIRFRGLHCGEQRKAVLRSDVLDVGTEVEHGARLMHSLADTEIEEWWLNRADGLEQGFELESNPCAGEGVLALEVELGDALLKETDHGVSLASVGHRALEYRDLSVIDATGRALPAWMEPSGSSVLLHFDPAGATWPITVDPLVKTLTAYLEEDSDHPLASAEGDQLGYAVGVTAVGGVPILAASSPYDDVNGLSDAGSVTLFRLDAASSTWWPFLKLTSSSPAASGRFGISLAIDNSRIVVGAPYEGVGGRAYVFTFDVASASVTSTQALNASTSASGDFFGNTVALSPSFIAVGAPGRDTAVGIDVGLVAIFEMSNQVFARTVEIANPSPTAGDRFGHAVAAWGKELVIGMPRDDSTNVANHGAILHYKRASAAAWTQTLYYKGTQTSEQLGWSVDIVQDSAQTTYLVGGSPGWDSSTLTSQGALYTTSRALGATSWSSVRRVVSAAPAANDMLGSAVAFGTDARLFATLGGKNRPTLEAFNRSSLTWSAQTWRVSLYNEPNPAFSLSANASHYAFGVPLADTPQTDRGGFRWWVVPDLAAKGDGGRAGDAKEGLGAFSGPLLSASSEGALAFFPREGNLVFVRDSNGWRKAGPLAEVSDLADLKTVWGGNTVVATGTKAGACVARVLAYDFTRRTWAKQAELPIPCVGTVLVDRDTIASIVPQGTATSISVYTRSGSAWALQQAWQVAAAFRGYALDRDTLALGADTTQVWRRTGAVWAKEADLTIPANPAWSGLTVTTAIGKGIDVSGDTLALCDCLSPIRRATPRILMYTRSGSTWGASPGVSTPNDNLAGFGDIISLEQNWMVFNFANRLDLYRRETTGWKHDDGLFVVALLAGNDLLLGRREEQLDGAKPLEAYLLSGTP